MRTLMAACLALLALAASSHAADLKVGDRAPDFKLQGSDGKQYTLSQFVGTKPVVIAWFPRAFTSGCTAECKNMKEEGAAIRKFDVAYFTASVDPPDQNKRFAESLEVDFPILSDPEKKTATDYGVLNDRSMANRWTFYIGADGVIKAIDKQVNSAQAGKDIANKLEELGIQKK